MYKTFRHYIFYFIPSDRNSFPGKLINFKFIWKFLVRNFTWYVKEKKRKREKQAYLSIQLSLISPLKLGDQSTWSNNQSIIGLQPASTPESLLAGYLLEDFYFLFPSPPALFTDITNIILKLINCREIQDAYGITLPYTSKDLLPQKRWYLAC